jgi:hypothetical protein
MFQSKGLYKNRITKSFYLSFALLLTVSSGCFDSSLAQADNSKPPENYFSAIIKNGILRWPSSFMPLRVYIKPGDTTDGFRPIFITLLEQAFSEWSIASENRISFTIVDDPTKAQIICGWTSDKNDMTKLTEGGHALVIPDGHKIKLVQITILTIA